MRSPRRLRSGVAFLIAAAGLGLCGYAALLWRELPAYSESDLRASVELNLAVDLSRRNATTPLDETAIATLRQNIRHEVEVDIARERSTVTAWLLSGLVMLAVAGFSALVAHRSN